MSKRDTLSVYPTALILGIGLILRLITEPYGSIKTRNIQ